MGKELQTYAAQQPWRSKTSSTSPWKREISETELLTPNKEESAGISEEKTRWMWKKGRLQGLNVKAVTMSDLCTSASVEW